MKMIFVLMLVAHFLAAAGLFVDGDKLSAFVQFVLGLFWFYLSCKE